MKELSLNAAGSRSTEGGGMGVGGMFVGPSSYAASVMQMSENLCNRIIKMTFFTYPGDETAGAWKDSPECRKFLGSSGLKDVGELKKYFAHLMSRITDEEGLHLAAWGDGLKEGPTPYDISKFPGKK